MEKERPEAKNQENYHSLRKSYSHLSHKATRILERVRIIEIGLKEVQLHDSGMIDSNPFVSVALDKYSGYPIGINVEEKPFNSISVLIAIRKSILPKPDLSIYGVQNKWLPFGLMNQILIYSNKNRGTTINFSLSKAGIDCQWRYAPQIDSQREILRSVIISGIPSHFIFPSPTQEEQKRPLFIMKRNDFLTHLYIALIDNYSQNWNRQVNGIPAQKWAESLNKVVIRTVFDSPQIEILLLPQCERTPFKCGIIFNKDIYWSPALNKLYETLHDKRSVVHVKYNPDDKSQIYVFDPTSAVPWITAYARNKTFSTEAEKIISRR